MNKLQAGPQVLHLHGESGELAHEGWGYRLRLRYTHDAQRKPLWKRKPRVSLPVLYSRNSVVSTFPACRAGCDEEGGVEGQVR